MSDHVRQSARLGGSWHYRCAAHEYRLTAAGHYHPLFFDRLMPWDHAPGWLPHQEAGGLIRPSNPHDGAHRHGDCFAPLAMTAKPSLTRSPDSRGWLRTIIEIATSLRSSR